MRTVIRDENNEITHKYSHTHKGLQYWLPVEDYRKVHYGIDAFHYLRYLEDHDADSYQTIIFKMAEGYLSPEHLRYQVALYCGLIDGEVKTTPVVQLGVEQK